MAFSFRSSLMIRKSFRENAAAVQVQQFLQIVVFQIGIALQARPELRLRKFRILEIAVLIFDETAVRVFLWLQGKGAHPSLLQQDLSRIDASQLHPVSIGIIKRTAVSLHKARIVGIPHCRFRHRIIFGIGDQPSNRRSHQQNKRQQQAQRDLNNLLHRTLASFYRHCTPYARHPQ